MDLLPAGAHVVEVGVGGRFEVAQELLARRPDIRLVATDVAAGSMTGAPSGVRCVVDDVVEPRHSIYEEAALIYSRRPGEEVQPALARLAASVRATLAISPLGTELVELGGSVELSRILRGPTGLAWHVFEPRSS